MNEEETLEFWREMQRKLDKLKEMEKILKEVKEYLKEDENESPN